VPWRFLDAWQLSVPRASLLPASKNLHRNGRRGGSHSALAGVPIGAGRDPVPSEIVETYQNIVALLGRVSLEHLINFGASIVNIIAKPENQRKT